MRELFGQLISLDPATSDALTAIEYFDRLVDAHVGVSMLLKESALLSRSLVGFEGGTRRRSFLPSGIEAAGVVRPSEARTVSVGDLGLAWMVTTEQSSPVADVVLDRLAISLRITESRVDESGAARSAIDILLSEPLPDERPTIRSAAAGRLRLEPGGSFRVLALPLEAAPPAGWPHGIMDSPWGPARAVIARSGASWAGPGGIGTLATVDGLPQSWRHAVIALRLSDGEAPFDAAELGALLLALQPEQSDILRKAEIDLVERALASSWTLPELVAVAEGASLRSIAAVSHRHHSTIEERLQRLPELLSFDPRTALGRTRLMLAILLRRLAEPR